MVAALPAPVASDDDEDDEQPISRHFRSNSGTHQPSSHIPQEPMTANPYRHTNAPDDFNRLLVKRVFMAEEERDKYREQLQQELLRAQKRTDKAGADAKRNFDLETQLREKDVVIEKLLNQITDVNQQMDQLAGRLHRRSVSQQM